MMFSHHLIVSGVACSPGCLGLSLASFLRVREEVQFDVWIRICSLLQRLLKKSSKHIGECQLNICMCIMCIMCIWLMADTHQASDVHHHNEKLVALVQNRKLHFTCHCTGHRSPGHIWEGGGTGFSVERCVCTYLACQVYLRWIK